MKTLYLIRHAKSDWTTQEEDFQRPLNERGHSDAPRMARHLKSEGYGIEKFVSSPAKRALTTCRYFAETYSNPEIKKVEDLYEPLLEDFSSVLSSLREPLHSVAVFSHNPTISQYASKLLETPMEFPTCAVAVIESTAVQWSAFQEGEINLKAFFTPRDI